MRLHSICGGHKVENLKKPFVGGLERQKDLNELTRIPMNLMGTERAEGEGEGVRVGGVSEGEVKRTSTERYGPISSFVSRARIRLCIYL